MWILEKLILLTLIFIPLGEFARISIFREAVLHPIDIGIFLILAIWLILKLIKKQNFLKIKNIIPVIIFLVVGLISLLVNLYWLKPNEILVSSLYLFRWISYAGIYFAVKDTSKYFIENILPRILILDGLIILVLGFIQIFYFPSLMDFQIFQWDKHMYRMFSVFLDPNYAGSFFVLYLIFMITLSFENFFKRKIKTSAIYFFISCCSLLAVFLTYSRSALIMLAVAGITYLIIINKKKLIFVLAASILIFFIIASNKFNIENLNLLRINSSLERIESAKIALQIFEKNPVLGVGFNTYRYAQIKYKFRQPSPEFTSHADAGTDNSLLFVAATMGIAGLIAFLFIWFNLVKKSFQKLNNKNRIYKACVISSITGLIISGQFNNSLFFGPLLIWIWIITATIDSR